MQWNHDVLQYLVLDHAIHHGDVGLMEDMLPHLLFRFIGGQNPKYANETLNCFRDSITNGLQMLRQSFLFNSRTNCKVTSCHSDFVRQHCSLINSTRLRNMFCGVDKGQEHNIKDIK